MTTAGQSLSLYAGLADLKAIRDFVRQVAEEAGVDKEAIYDILLATTEAATNILVHGYEGLPGWIEIEVRQEDGALSVVLRDAAEPFDPTQEPAPELGAPLEKRPLGKMGLHLMRETMDRLEYKVLPQGGNELRLVKESVIQK